MDLEWHSYRPLQELETYCLNAAGSIRQLCVEVFGFTDDEPARRADSACRIFPQPVQVRLHSSVGSSINTNG